MEDPASYATQGGVGILSLSQRKMIRTKPVSLSYWLCALVLIPLPLPAQLYQPGDVEQWRMLLSAARPIYGAEARANRQAASLTR